MSLPWTFAILLRILLAYGLCRLQFAKLWWTGEFQSLYHASTFRCGKCYIRSHSLCPIQLNSQRCLSSFQFDLINSHPTTAVAVSGALAVWSTPTIRISALSLEAPVLWIEGSFLALKPRKAHKSTLCRRAPKPVAAVQQKCRLNCLCFGKTLSAYAFTIEVTKTRLRRSSHPVATS